MTTVYTVDVDGYAPEVTAITRPFLQHWVNKIGAELYVIKHRKWPQYTPAYEKLQIYDLARERKDDRIIFIDADALVHPEFYNPCDHLPMDTVMHFAHDMAGHRWQYDNYFRRDGRHIGSANWFAVGSSWTLDLWREQDDITYEEMLKRIFPSKKECDMGMKSEHLIDDYILSRNIARFGLKFTTLVTLMEGNKQLQGEYFRHEYGVSMEVKLASLQKTLEAWKL